MFISGIEVKHLSSTPPPLALSVAESEYYASVTQLKGGTAVGSGAKG